MIFAFPFPDNTLCALLYMFLFLTAEILVLFYFIETGKFIKENTREHGLPKENIEHVRQLKRRLFPRVSANLILFVITFLTGSMVRARHYPVWIHLLPVLLFAYALFQSIPLKKRLLLENVRLLNSVYRALNEEG